MRGFNFIVFGEPTEVAKPTEGSFDDPTLGKEMKALGIFRSFNDLHTQFSFSRKFLHPASKFSSVAPVYKDHLKPSKEEKERSEKLCAVAVLNIGRVNHDSEYQPHRINQKVSFSSHDLLSRIESTLAWLANHFNALAVDDRSRGSFFFELLTRTFSTRT